jgi:hypothetical protein
MRVVRNCIAVNFAMSAELSAEINVFLNCGACDG